ncbi:MAG: glycosyltransferase family 4 protein [Thermoplasmata archaeon]
MRIAEVPTRFPPGPGGVERHVDELSRRLAARGNSVSVLTSHLYREFPWQELAHGVPREETRGGVRVRRLPVTSLAGGLHYPFFHGLSRALRAEAPDVIHVHTYGTHQATVASRWRRGGGPPVVLTTHFHPIWSIEGGRFRHWLRGFYDRRISGRVLGGIDRVVVQTREEERLLRELRVPLPPLRIIPPGRTPLPPPPPDPDAFRRSLGLGGPFVLFVGRLASNKGLLELVEAFRPLAAHDRSVTLVLIGEDGGMRPAIEDRIRRRSLQGRVRLTGFLPDERMLSAAFREARLFVLPSQYEAFGLVLLEALAQGTAVVASRVGGIPEVLDGGAAGRLVPPGEIGPLAVALRELWEDEPARRRLGEYGRTTVLPRYDWDQVVDRLETLFAEVTRR